MALKGKRRRRVWNGGQKLATTPVYAQHKPSKHAKAQKPAANRKPTGRIANPPRGD
jgi:hypothetical protein